MTPSRPLGRGAALRLAAGAALASLPGCGSGLDTLFTDDGYRYTLWVARRDAGAIESIVVDPESRALESRRSHPVQRLFPTHLAADAASTRIVAAGAEQPGSDWTIQSFRVEERGVSINWTDAIPEPLQAVFHLSFSRVHPDRIFLLSDDANAAPNPLQLYTLQADGHSLSWEHDMTLSLSPGATPAGMAELPYAGALVIPVQGGSAPQSTMIVQYAGNAYPTPWTSGGTAGAGALTAWGSGSWFFSAPGGGGPVSRWVFDGSGPAIVSERQTPTLSDPTHLRADPKEEFLFIVGNGQVRIAGVDRNTGALDLRTESRTVGSDPRAAEIDPSGKLLAISDCASNRVYVFLLNRSTKSLRSVSGSPFSVSGCPSGLAWTRVPSR